MMKRTFFTSALRCAALALFFSSALCAAPQVIPAPLSVINNADGEQWKKEMGLQPSYDDNSLEQISGWVKALLKEQQVDTVGTPWQISLDAPFDEVGDEGYILITEKKGWELSAYNAVGLFYGLQTARQLIAHSGGVVEAMKIVDRPNSGWRGLMLDPARNFLGLEYYKKVVDQMATLKLNRLHLHLSDDQGWRLEIKSLPKLTSVGSASSVSGLATQGFLTQEEWRELNNYALGRAVVIVPEFDLPGHTHALKNAYPEQGCGENRAWPYRDIEVGFSHICWNDNTKAFLTTLLEELAEITPGSWIHIGGDEVLGGMVNYNASIEYMESLLNNKGKVLVAWQEAAVGYKKSSSIQQMWQQIGTARWPNWINSTCSSAYIDHSDGSSDPGEKWMGWCSYDGAVTPQKLYFISPGTIGIEAALWGEYVSSTAVSQAKLYPRMIALAEAGWLKLEKRNWNDYSARLSRATEKWFIETIFKPEEASTAIAPSSRIVRGTPQFHRIYTLDGRVVTQFAAQEGLSAEAQLGVGVLPSGTYILRTRYSEGGWREKAIRMR